MRYVIPSNRPPKISYVLGAIAVFYSAKFLYMVVPQWFEPASHDSAIDWALAWLNHTAYLVPKLGVMIGFWSLFRFPNHSFKIYGICWAVGTLQTFLYYLVAYQRAGSWAAMSFTDHGGWYISQHAIPHMFYPLMLFLLWRTRQLQD